MVRIKSFWDHFLCVAVNVSLTKKPLKINIGFLVVQESPEYSP